MYNLPERGGGGGIIRAMPERKHSFFRRCSLTNSLTSGVDNFLPAKCATYSGLANYQNIIQILSNLQKWNIKFIQIFEIWNIKIKTKNVTWSVSLPKTSIQKADRKKHYSGCRNPNEKGGDSGEGKGDNETGSGPIKKPWGGVSCPNLPTWVCYVDGWMDAHFGPWVWALSKDYSLPMNHWPCLSCIFPDLLKRQTSFCIPNLKHI